MRTIKATALALLIGLPAQAGTLDKDTIFVTDGKGFNTAPGCSCWNDSVLGQICVDHSAPNSGFLVGRMVFWALHQTPVTFSTYVGGCGGQTIATATTPATQ